jgi:hypothetical protein
VTESGGCRRRGEVHIMGGFGGEGEKDAGGRDGSEERGVGGA